jgi:histidinol dehydrogenase
LDSQVILVSTSKKLIDAVEEVQIQLEALPREEIAEKAIANSKLIVENDQINGFNQ